MNKKPINYQDSGVNIAAGDETVQRIKEHARSTFTKEVLSGIGHFGSFFQLPVNEYKEPVLVSSVDGVGTKIKIAFLLDRHITIGEDLVNHCVNDIAVCGAKPLFFLDYLAFGKLVPEKAEQIISGFAKACRENGCSLVGGETAEMPGLYKEDEYDLSGTIVGIVEKNKIIDGKKIQKGDLLFGFPSNGLHTNGYSLARSVLLPCFSLDSIPEQLRNEKNPSLTLGEELLKVHRSYLKIIRIIIDNINVSGFSHITGGGIIGNTMRIIPDGLGLNINWESWERPGIFNLIQETGNVEEEEMRKVFNLGIGLIAVISAKEKNKFEKLCEEMNEQFYLIGEVV